VGADTGPADSVDTDSGPSTASTFGLTEMLRGNVAADGGVSLDSALYRCPLFRHVHENACMDTPYSIIKNASQQQRSDSSLNIYLFIAPNKMAAKHKVNYF